MKVLISENRDKYSINYTLEDKEIFSNVEYKVLRNAETDGFIKCVKISHNGKLKLVYDISPYRDLLSLTREMSLNSFLTVVSRLLTIVINVGENGFMQYKNIDPNINNIYVDTNNLNVYMIYLPLQYEGNDSEEIFIRELKNNIIQAINFNRTYYGETITILRNNLVSDKTLQEILKELSNKNKTDKVKKAPVNEIPEKATLDRKFSEKVEPEIVTPAKEIESKVIPVREEPAKVAPKKIVTVKDVPKKEAPAQVIQKKVEPVKVAPDQMEPVEEEVQGKKRPKSLLGSLDKLFNKALEHAQLDVVENYYGESQITTEGEPTTNSKTMRNSSLIGSQMIPRASESKKRLSTVSSISSISNADEATTTFMKALSQPFINSVVTNKSVEEPQKVEEGQTEQVSRQQIEEMLQRTANNDRHIEEDYSNKPISNDGSRTLVLKRINTSVPLSFVIGKKEYAIGSNKYMVDGVIENKAVSRLHCIVYVKNNGYYIQDIDSKNGTYVNSLRLQKNVMTKINVGDKVSIANCDFLVREIEI